MVLITVAMSILFSSAFNIVLVVGFAFSCSYY